MLGSLCDLTFAHKFQSQLILLLSFGRHWLMQFCGRDHSGPKANDPRNLSFTQLNGELPNNSSAKHDFLDNWFKLCAFILSLHEIHTFTQIIEPELSLFIALQGRKHSQRVLQGN